MFSVIVKTALPLDWPAGEQLVTCARRWLMAVETTAVPGVEFVAAAAVAAVPQMRSQQGSSLAAQAAAAAEVVAAAAVVVDVAVVVAVFDVVVAAVGESLWRRSW